MRVLGEGRSRVTTHHTDVLDGQLASKVLPVGIVLGSEAQLCDGGAGSDGSYGAGERACRGESTGEHLGGRQ
jgi:hypothetical protein